MPSEEIGYAIPAAERRGVLTGLVRLNRYALLLLIIPFVRLGEHMLGSPPQPITLEAGFALLSSGVIHAIVVMWDAIVHAALAWIVVGPPLICGLYLTFKPLLVRARAAYA